MNDVGEESQNLCALNTLDEHSHCLVVGQQLDALGQQLHFGESLQVVRCECLDLVDQCRYRQQLDGELRHEVVREATTDQRACGQAQNGHQGDWLQTHIVPTHSLEQDHLQGGEEASFNQGTHDVGAHLIHSREEWCELFVLLQQHPRIGTGECDQRVQLQGQRDTVHMRLGLQLFEQVAALAEEDFDVANPGEAVLLIQGNANVAALRRRIGLHGPDQILAQSLEPLPMGHWPIVPRQDGQESTGHIEYGNTGLQLHIIHRAE